MGIFRLVGNFGKGFVRTWSGVFNRLFGIISNLGARRFFIMFMIASSIISALQDIKKENSPYPLIIALGGRMVSGDEMLYKEVKELENRKLELQDSGMFSKFSLFLEKVQVFLGLLSAMGFIYINFVFWNWVFSLHNESEKGMNIVFSLFMILFVQMIFSAMILANNLSKGVTKLHGNDDISRIKDFTKRIMPGKGIIAFMKNMPFIFDRIFGTDRSIIVGNLTFNMSKPEYVEV